LGFAVSGGVQRWVDGLRLYLESEREVMSDSRYTSCGGVVESFLASHVAVGGWMAKGLMNQ